MQEVSLHTDTGRMATRMRIWRCPQQGLPSCQSNLNGIELGLCFTWPQVESTTAEYD
jgi:hypothetical protein